MIFVGTLHVIDYNDDDALDIYGQWAKWERTT